MFHEMSKRNYRLRKRATQQEETRQRIVQAALELHTEVGPAATSISAIAERAGVQRLTVYRHFPDDTALLSACSAHASAAHPPPDPAAWAEIEDPSERLHTALRALYGYYRGGERMLVHVLRDAERLPALAAVLAPMRGYLQAVAEMLGAGWKVQRAEERLFRAALAHAIQFETWRSLATAGLDDAEAARLIGRLVAAAADPHPAAPPG
jgi:AcrR family transcriptional regulator